MERERRIGLLVAGARRGRVSRRAFLARGAALGLSASAAATLARGISGGTAAVQAAQGTQTTVNFLHSIPPETEQFWKENLLPPFYEANPDCVINAQNYGTENATTIRTRVQAGGDGAPHMAWLASTEQGVFGDADLLADIQGFLDDKPELRDNIRPELLTLSSYDGAVRTLPWTTNNLAVWINVDAFEEAGVPIPSKNPEETWTWEEFKDAAQKTSTGDRKGFLLTVGGGWESWAFEAWIAQAEGVFIDEEGVPGFAEAPGVEAMTFLYGLKQAEATLFSEPDRGFDPAPWYAGRVAMVLNGPWNFPTLSKFEDFRFDVVPYPRNKRPATNLGGNQLYIFNTGGDAVTACALNYGEYMLSDEFQTRFTIQDGSFPVTKSAVESEEYQAHLEQYPYLAGWFNQTPYGVARSSTPAYSDISTIFSDAYDEIMLNDAPIEETLSQAAEEAASF